MLMEHHHHAQGRPSWTSSLYSTSTVGASNSISTSSSAITYDALRPPTYVAETAQYQQPTQHQQYSQDQDNHYRYPFETSRSTLDPRAPFAPLPPPPRDDGLPGSRLPFPAPGLPRPMIGGSLSPHIRIPDKTSALQIPAVGTPAFTIPRSGGPTAPKRATDEERRAKHREAQRRFVKRKKIEMLQLKQLAVELEKRHDLLQVVSEREALVRENQTLLHQLESQKENAQESPTDKMSMKQEFPENPETEVRDTLRPEIKWETRTFEW